MEYQASSFVSRRIMLAGGLVAGIAGCLSFRQQQRVVPYRVDVDKTMPPVEKTGMPHGPEQPVHWNRPSQLGVIMSNPEEAGQEGTVYLARWGDKVLTDHAEIERKNIIPASMQKSYAALLIVDMLELPNLYGKLAASGTPNMDGAAKPLISLDDMVEIKASAAALNSTHYKQPGQKFTLRHLLTAALQKSDNGAIEALAVYCGEELIKNGYATDDRAPGAAHRAFNRWGEQQARERYGLSPQFRMLNAHGLPGYETLVDLASFKEWSAKQKRQPWSSKVTTKQNSVPHFGRRDADDKLVGFEKLPVESGICTVPTANNCWGWLDGVRIMAQWQMRHPDLTRELFKNGVPRLAGALKQRLLWAVEKTGTSNNSLACKQDMASVVCADGSVALVYGMVAGQLRKGDKYPGGTSTYDHRHEKMAQVLNMFGQPKPPLQPMLPTPRKDVASIALQPA